MILVVVTVDVKTTIIKHVDVRKCSSLPQEWVNGKSRDDNFLPGSDLSCGYSINCVSLQDNHSGYSPPRIHCNQIHNCNPLFTHFWYNSSGNNPKLARKPHGVNLSTGIPMLNNHHKTCYKKMQK